MYKRTLIAATTLAIAASQQAQAENWIQVTHDTTGSRFSIDMDTYKRTGNYVTLWWKGDHSKDATYPSRETKSQFRIDCSDRTSTMLFFISYKPNGDVGFSKSFETYEQKKQPSIPGTIGETMVDVACHVPKDETPPQQ